MQEPPGRGQRLPNPDPTQDPRTSRIGSTLPDELAPAERTAVLERMDHQPPRRQNRCTGLDRDLVTVLWNGSERGYSAGLAADWQNWDAAIDEAECSACHTCRRWVRETLGDSHCSRVETATGCASESWSSNHPRSECRNRPNRRDWMVVCGCSRLPAFFLQHRRGDAVAVG